MPGTYAAPSSTASAVRLKGVDLKMAIDKPKLVPAVTLLDRSGDASPLSYVLVFVSDGHEATRDGMVGGI